jgi:parallel beta-helix repeat protein
MGGSGIFVTANSNHNQVTGNTMTGLGKINVGTSGIHLENSANNLIDSNTIDGSGRWGVDLYPTDGVSLVGNTVSNNVIRNTSQQTADTGAIYSYAGTSPGYVNESTTITGKPHRESRRPAARRRG